MGVLRRYARRWLLMGLNETRGAFGFAQRGPSSQIDRGGVMAMMRPAKRSLSRALRIMINRRRSCLRTVVALAAVIADGAPTALAQGEPLFKSKTMNF
jgi:hypothetical protein